MKYLLFAVSMLYGLSSYATKNICEDLEPIETVDVKYPVRESPAPQSGYVIVKFKISDRGYVYSPEVIESHAQPNKSWATHFEKSALEAIVKWHYKYRNEACFATQKFTFELNE